MALYLGRAYTRVFLEHDFIHDLFENLGDDKAILTGDIEEREILFQEPWSVRCEKYECSRGGGLIQRFLYCFD